MTKTAVIYHSADYDGIFCREIAHKFLPSAELIGWNFGDPLLDPSADQIYILDLSPDCLAPEARLSWSKFIWIDHHKTSIEKWGTSIPGYRIDGVAACRLAWHWFTHPQFQDRAYDGGMMPSKIEYVERELIEPLAVRLAGEYDIWDKRDPDAETFQYALRASESVLDWERLLSLTEEDYVSFLLAGGRSAQRYASATDASTCKHRTWIMEWEGLHFLCVNSARFNSLFFAARDIPETGHDALLGFCFDGKCWTVSLYHAKHRTDLDLSEIAKRHGGGGHRGACGFTSKTLPFCLS